MLADIAIENLGVISRAAMELSPGLTVLTGRLVLVRPWW